MKKINIYLPNLNKKNNLGQGLFHFIFYTFESENINIYTLDNDTADNTYFIKKSALSSNVKLSIFYINNKRLTVLLEKFLKGNVFKFVFKKIINFIKKFKNIVLGIIKSFKYSLRFILFFLRKQFSKINFYQLPLPNGTIFLSPIVVPYGYKAKSRDVLICADFLHIDFPETIPASIKQVIEGKAKKNFDSFNRIVCFSEHVRDRHLVDYFKVSPSKIFVIKHAPHDLSIIWGAPRFSKIDSLEVFYYVLNYFKEFNLIDVKSLLAGNFIITSSTYRANYKNFKILFDLINSGWFENNNIKIFLTHVPDEYKKILINKDFVYFINDRVDNEILAYLYSRATIAVHTSFFEGGANVAPFSEAVSVGTPCIAAFSRATDEAGLSKEWLFNGNSLPSLIHRLDFALNSQSLLRDQIDFYIEYEKIFNKLYVKNSWKTLIFDS